MRHTRLLPLAALALAACGGDSGTGPTPARITALPRALAASERTIVEGTTAFGLQLLRETVARRDADSNTVISPLSVSMSLGMAYAGARGETRTEMARVLGLGAVATDAAALDGYRELMTLLGSLDRGVRFTYANAAWLSRAFPFEATYVRDVQQTFGADVFARDFAAPATVTELNAWVRDRTQGRIPSIVQAIRADEVALLVNALHFKGDWRDRFDAGRTADAPFRVAPGRTTTVRMMQRSTGALRVGSVARAQVLELPYGGDAWAMTIVVPPVGTLRALVDTLTPAGWTRLVGSLGDANPGTMVFLPRFRTEASLSLAEPLATMGMARAFSQGADFSGMRAQGGLYLTRVAHRTWLDVNEEGTEAAAATATGVGVVSLPGAISVDAPFLFAIRERLSGAVLFVGTIVTPRAP